MSARRLTILCWLVLVLSACAATTAQAPLPGLPMSPPPTKGIPPLSGIRDSVYLPVERNVPAPVGYGLYTLLLTRSVNTNTVRVLASLLSTTVSAGDAAIARENLNLLTIPVKSASVAARELASARQQPDATAAAVLQRTYDFGQAALLLASLCRPEQGAAVMKACGSPTPEGPLLVTTMLPSGRTLVPGQRLLIVNLSGTPQEAVREVLAAYHRQILSKDWPDRAELDSWRLQVLNHLLNAAPMLPGISKAYAAYK